MKIKVEANECIGCGACQAIAPEIFEINDEGLSEVIVDEVPEDKENDAIDAVEGCPTNAIKKIEN